MMISQVVLTIALLFIFIVLSFSLPKDKRLKDKIVNGSKYFKDLRSRGYELESKPRNISGMVSYLFVKRNLSKSDDNVIVLCRKDDKMKVIGDIGYGIMDCSEESCKYCPNLKDKNLK